MRRLAKERQIMRKGEGISKPEALMSVKQVAALDGCSEKTVRRAIDAGLLAVVRIGPGGRLLRIHPADHAAYRRGQ